MLYNMINSDANIYVSTSKDEYGYSRIYHYKFPEMNLVPVDTIKDHCFSAAESMEDLCLLVERNTSKL